MAEFNAAKAQGIVRAMSDIGFSFRRGIPDTESGSTVTYEGERGDGTKVTIAFEKGQNYKSPKELAEQA